MLDGQSGAGYCLLQRHLHLLERLVDLRIQPLRVVDRQLHRDTRERREVSASVINGCKMRSCQDTAVCTSFFWSLFVDVDITTPSLILDLALASFNGSVQCSAL